MIIIKLCKQGFHFTDRMVKRETSKIVPTLKDKTVPAQEQIVRRFTKSLGLTYHSAPHTVQKHFKETENDAKDVITMTKDCLAAWNKGNILNLDQMPIAYSFHPSKTFESKGMKTIKVHASNTDTKHVMAAATITASGKMLPPFKI